MYSEKLASLSTVRCWKNGLSAEKRNSVLCKNIRKTMALIGILLLAGVILILRFNLPQQHTEEKESVFKSRLGRSIPESISYHLAPQNYEYKEYEDVFEEESTKPRIIWNNDVVFEYSKNIMTFLKNFSEAVLKVYFGQFLSKYEIENASRTLDNDSVTMIFTKIDSEVTTFQMTKSNFSDKCYEVVWETLHTNKLEDCFDTEFSHWYGLGEIFNQKWPIDKITFPSAPFLTNDFISSYSVAPVFGGVLEPLAVSSKGVGIYIHNSVPLHVSMDSEKGKFCIRADKKNYNRKYKKNDTIKLAYTICIRDNIREVHQVLYNQFIRKPSGVPDKEMMLSPIWSTWVKYKKGVNEDKIRTFATEIRDYGFPGSILEIDDKYSTEYGDYNFDPTKFSEVVSMFQFLKTKNFRVTTWVYPFSNLESESFLEGVNGSYFVKSGPKKVPGITKWWDGMGGILDTTNKYAVEWFIKKLKDFQYLPIDGFKFDAGETDYLPYAYEFSEPQINPNYFSKNYVELVAAKFKLAEVRVGYKSQSAPILVRLLDRTSVWETTNGLKSVLTATLTFGILGYPFVLPDMVGGNAYIVKPTKELYIRWAQLNAFLPSIQFSLPPWNYDNETVAIVKDALALRQNLSEIIYSLAVESVKTGEPIVRPLWWHWPTDHETFVIYTEFMLGKDYLIAPVLHRSVVSHTVYLPAGIWQEQWKDRKIINMSEGGLRYYNVSLRDICYFKLIRDTTSSK